jgi:lipoate-protein ligase B
MGWEEADRLQAAVRAQLLASEDAPERLLLLEHPPTVTIGRHGDLSHLVESPEGLAARGVALVHASRGGHLTWHGPGQLVCYPVVHLRRRRIGPREHVERLAASVVAWLHELGLEARWRDDAPGVWVGEPPLRKVASVGVHVHRDVTAHGVAVNVSAELAGFRLIRPCGFAPDVMTTIAREIGHAPPLAEAARGLAEAFARQHQVALAWDPAPIPTG